MFLFPISIGLVAVTLVVGVILILVAGRRDDDAAGRRTEARYLGAVGFVTLFVALFASFVVVASLMDVIVGQASSNDDAYRGVTGAGLAAIVAGAIFVFHYQRRQNLMVQGAFERGAPALVVRAYFYSVCFATALVVLVSAPVAVYGIFKIIGPGVYGTGPHSPIRDEGIAELVSFAYLAGASAVIFLVAWQHSGSRRSRTEASGTIPATGAPQ